MQFLHEQCEGLDHVPILFSQGEYFITFALESGYHHVDIQKESWKYLGFTWDNAADSKFYMFTVLPFGLAMACYVVTELLRQLVKRWRGMDLKAIVFLDDGICSAKSLQGALHEKSILLGDLDQAGLVLIMCHNLSCNVATGLVSLLIYVRRHSKFHRIISMSTFSRFQCES